MSNALVDEPWSGHEIRDRRIERGLSQGELAELIGVHRGTIRNAELGKPMEQRTWLGLRRVLGTPMASIGHGLPDAPAESSEAFGLGVIVGVMERLDSDERRRVLAYLVDRFGEVERG